MEGVRHPQPEHVTHSQRADLSYTNCGTRKDSSLYIKHFLCVKWLIHLPQGPHEWRVCQLFEKKRQKKRKRGYEGQIEEPYPSKKCKRQEDILKAMNNLIVNWVCQKHPIKRRNNTYNYTLSHLYRVRGFQYLRHL